MPERVKIICPKCESIIAVAPESGLSETDLVCSNCGAHLRGSGPLEEAVEIKEVVEDSEQEIQDEVRFR